MSTIFEKIIAGEIPANKVYEDNECLSILDINPVADGHLLLIPKESYRWIQDVPDELTSHLFVKAKDLIKAQKAALGCDYVQISVVGKDVPHVHIHLIPRYFDDGLESWETHEYENGQPEKIATQIAERL
ncbi:MAG: HIT family protein [Candidatus Paceibacterota bacterium]